MNVRQSWPWIIPVLLAITCMTLAAAEPDAKDASEKSDSTGQSASAADGPPVSLERDAVGRRVFKLSDEVRKRIDLVARPLAAGQVQPGVAAYGRLIESPDQIFTLRSPIAGYLESADKHKWPRVGDYVDADSKVARIRPRLTAIERYDLASRMMQANADVEAISAQLAAAKSSYENKKSLNQQQKVVTDRALESALATVKSEEARLAAAKQTVQLLSDALATGEKTDTGIALPAYRAGEVIDVSAQPGEAVESGQPLLRILDTRHLVARVAIPLGTLVDVMPTSARVLITGQDQRTYPATVRSAIPAADMAAAGQTFLIAFDVADAPLRPGIPVQAELELPGAPQTGAIVPRSAVIRFGGSAFVYQQTSDDEFTRVQITTDTPLDAGWLVSAGLKAGDRVVVVGAGTLLSEELRSQIEAEAEGGD